jgi:hypothetical protein
MQSESMMGATYACFQIANKGIYQFAFGQVFWMSLSRYNWLGSASIGCNIPEAIQAIGNGLTRRSTRCFGPVTSRLRSKTINW